MGTVDIRLTPAEIKCISEGTCHVYKSVPCGRPGDTFTVNDRRFEIIDVSERSLKAIANRYYRMEGYDSPADFLLDWTAHYSLQDPECRIYVHWFRKIDSHRRVE
jgi:hypothetical protein